MQTLKKDLVIPQGDRFILPVNVVESGIPLDLTGHTARMEIRASKRGGTILATLTSSDYLIVNEPAGRVTIHIPTAITRTYTWNYGYYDLMLIYPSGEWDRLMQGVAEVDGWVTQPQA